MVGAASNNDNDNDDHDFPPPETDIDLITADRLSNFIDSGTEYITRACHTLTQDIEEREGKFTYIAFLEEDLPTDFMKEDQVDYNLLRHNGAIYSLTLSYNRTPSGEILETIKRAVHWLKKTAIKPVPDVSHNNNNKASNDDEEEVEEEDEGEGNDQEEATEKQEEYTKFLPNLSAAWEDGTILGGGSTLKPTAKLGGAGLALIALVGLEKISPGSTPMKELRSLANFIHYLQNEDGSFTCRYKPHKGGKDTSFVSLYYPGEAALGLVYLAELEDDDSAYRQRWIHVATKALLYLEDYRRNMELNEVEPDHWALLATARLLPLLDSSKSEYWHVYQHAVKVMTSMVAVQSREDLLQESQGCHTADGRTCPTSTRLEGLLAGLTFLKDDEMFLEENVAEPLKERILYFVKYGADFVLNSMEKTTSDENTNKGMGGGVPLHYPPKSRHHKEVRIDYVQHSISAMMAYEQMLNHEGPYAFHSRKEQMRHVASKVKKRIRKVANATSNKIEERPYFWMVAFASVAIVMVLAGISMIKTTKSGIKKNM